MSHPRQAAEGKEVQGPRKLVGSARPARNYFFLLNKKFTQRAEAVTDLSSSGLFPECPQHMGLDQIWVQRGRQRLLGLSLCCHLQEAALGLNPGALK